MKKKNSYSNITDNLHRGDKLIKKFELNNIIFTSIIMAPYFLLIPTAFHCITNIRFLSNAFY